MNILVACEESQAVTIKLREKGHNAFSCDIQECSGGFPEWHILNDVTLLLDGNCTFYTMDGAKHNIIGKWDMVIAFPPCTHLAVSGAPSFEKKRNDGRQKFGIEFFCMFLYADCDKIAIENPVNIISGEYVTKHFPELAKKYNLPLKPTQTIHPWMFGDNAHKKTCLWLKGLKPLEPKFEIEPYIETVEWINKKTGKTVKMDKWYYDAFAHSKSANERSVIRSKTFPGIAQAMAEQWG